jgi:glycosyltransferase involved in cell wall biosynthesis
MRKKILVTAPVLTQSGYGEQSRFALRALRSREDLFDIYLDVLNWGQTSWQWRDTEERRWIDSIIQKTALHAQQKGHFDMSLQITIPNEWKKRAPINIGYTAGIETTKVAPQWIEKSFLMDKIIVVSNHAKEVFQRTSYTAKNQETGEVIDDFRCRAPIDVVNYPVRVYDQEEFDLQLECDFNFLVVAQWSPRKNLENTIKWFVEEFIDQKVGLVLKGNIAKNSLIDFYALKKRVKDLLAHEDYKDRKCKIHILHGDLSENQLAYLYNHEKIKALLSLSHGEGYGLPIFEAAYYGLPIITTEWSGQADFIFAEITKKNGKKKKRPYFASVSYDIQPIPKESVWNGVLQADSMWCQPKEGSAKMKMRDVRKNHGMYKNQAEKLKTHVLENFTVEGMYKKFIDSILSEGDIELQYKDYVFVSDYFSNQMLGGAELSLQTLMEECPGTKLTVNSANLSKTFIDFYKDSMWIFGNIAHMDDKNIKYILDSNIKYHFIEFDYKFCEYRNPALYHFLENRECNYNDTEKGKLIENFINNSQQTFLMSEGQKSTYKSALKNLKEDKLFVLSSVFNSEFFETIENLNRQIDKKTRNKWIVLGSRSWVKGTSDSEKWCKDNNLDYEVICDLSPEELLKKLSEAKGICFKPTGLDTCPRYVIEAKLLGCELDINDNVQHINEEWFKTDDIDITIDYLKNRRNIFWEQVNGRDG